MRLKLENIFVLLSLVIDAGGAIAQQIETARPVERIESAASSAQVYLIPEYFRLTSDAEVLAGPALGFGFDYEFTPKWAAGVEVKHAYSGISGLFVSTLFRGRYAITGAFKPKSESVRVKGWPLIEYNEFQLSGWRGEFHIVNYSVFTSQSEVPFTGFGFAGTYEWVYNERYSLEPGGSIDQTANSQQSVQALRLFCRIKMRL